MKKILSLLIVALVLVACKSEPKDYVTISGKIDNVGEHKTLTILNRAVFKRDITINDDGTFKDTMKVAGERYLFKIGDKYGNIYLENNNDTKLSFDAEDFDNSLKFEGDAADKNNYMAESIKLQIKYLSEDLLDKTEEGFDKAFADYKKDLKTLIENSPTIDSTFYIGDVKQTDMMYNSYKRYHQSKLQTLKDFPKGSPSPTFENYENHAGGTTSLSDLKGKYVYVDVWATWCGPCKAEIPSLKKIEAEYHGKNIEFVSISVDNGRGYKAESQEEAEKLAKEGWNKMVNEKELGGIQLYADKAWKSDFVQGYKIQGIPRFILIDPDGNIVSPDAPRPSSKKLKELFDSLNI